MTGDDDDNRKRDRSVDLERKKLARLWLCPLDPWIHHVSLPPGGPRFIDRYGYFSEKQLACATFSPCYSSLWYVMRRMRLAWHSSFDNDKRSTISPSR